jgi:hypothetical protein
VALSDRRLAARIDVVKVSRLRPLAPRRSAPSVTLYRSRAAVEREFDGLEDEWVLSPLRVRRIELVRRRADPTILAKLSCAFARARAVPVAA